MMKSEVEGFASVASQVSKRANGAARRCFVSVMDSIADPNIVFDESGISNYVHEYRMAFDTLPRTAQESEECVSPVLRRIRAARVGDYDCVVGLSGGVDSTYLALMAVRLGLRPLAVHFDYGWNSETAVGNIERCVRTLNLDLHTYVMDWEEFRDVQRSYFLASVIDLDVPADHMIAGAVYRVAHQNRIRFILNGANIATEHTMPPSWNYRKHDLVNLRSIHRRFGSRSLRKLPTLGVWQQAYYQLVAGIESVNLLNYCVYEKRAAVEEISRELGWRPYGGKHHESIFTRFYQGYLLPRKFGVDKRKPHLTDLILSGQMSRDEALTELATPPYDPALMEQDQRFVAKKLGFSDDEFERVLSLPNVDHSTYGTDVLQRRMYRIAMRAGGPLSPLVRRLRGRAAT